MAKSGKPKRIKEVLLQFICPENGKIWVGFNESISEAGTPIDNEGNDMEFTGLVRLIDWKGAYADYKLS